MSRFIRHYADPPTHLVSTDEPMSIIDQVHDYSLQPITALPLNHSALPLNLAMGHFIHNICIKYEYIQALNSQNSIANVL